MPVLIVTLAASLPTANVPCSVVLSDDGNTMARQTEATAANMAALMLGMPAAEVVAIVPAQCLSWHRVNLPKGSLQRSWLGDGTSQRLRSVLDGLLEERLLQDTADLHFALQPHAARAAHDQPSVWVAACNRAWLNAWLAVLEQAGRAALRIVPQVEPLLDDSTTGAVLHLGGAPDAPQLTWSSALGVGTLPWSATSMALVGHPLVTQQASPTVLAEPSVAQVAESAFPGRVGLQTPAQRALVAAQSTWDLAQFDLLRSRQARSRKRLSQGLNQLLSAPQWKPARWLLLALVLVNLAGLQMWVWKEQSALIAKKAALTEILKSTFPEARVVVDAPAQMEKLLRNLQRQNGTATSGDLESMLARFQATAPEGSVPTAIEFVAGELRLKLPAAASMDWNAMTARMKGFGYAVSVQGDTIAIQPSPTTTMQERKP